MTILPIWVADHTVIPIMVHKHDYFQVMYCRGGSGTMLLDGKSYPAEADCVYFSKPKTMHGFEPKDSLTLVEIKFEADAELTALCNQIPLMFSVESMPGVKRAINNIVRDSSPSESFVYELTEARIKIFVIELLRAFGITGGNDQRISRERVTGGSEDREFYKIISFIDEHINEEINLDMLADKVHFNKSYLIVRFKEIWGISPMKYVNRVRIERARELLEKTDMSVTDIALEVGFSGIHYFSRYFKAQVGLTPQEYRAAHSG